MALFELLEEYRLRQASLSSRQRRMTMPQLEIIGAPQSTFVRTTRMALEEKGVPYKLTPARPHSPEVDCVPPFGKIPVMRHGDFTLCESRAIIGYADRVFDGPKLIPDEPK